MAASLVLNGTLTERAFFDAAFSNEMLEVFCKVQSFFERPPQARKKAWNFAQYGSFNSWIGAGPPALGDDAQTIDCLSQESARATR
jgi:hypothetical protein